MINGHKSAAHTDSSDGGTGKPCLGRGRHGPSASSLLIYHVYRQIGRQTDKPTQTDPRQKHNVRKKQSSCVIHRRQHCTLAPQCCLRLDLLQYAGLSSEAWYV